MYKILVILIALVQLSFCDKCIKPGPACSRDCKHRIHCLDGNNEEAIQVAHCDEPGKFCDVNNDYKCTAPYCAGDPDDAPFICGGIGIFPHSHDCSRFYICVEPNVQPQSECKCADDEFYHHDTISCIKGRTEPGCVTINDCATLGHCHKIPQNDGSPTTFYKISTDYFGDGRLYPVVFQCSELSADCTCSVLKSPPVPKSELDFNSRNRTCSPYVSPNSTSFRDLN